MRYLVALADELNFTRAAARCNVSQPPLSRAIRELEHEVGTALFVRDKHNVSITPAGTSLSEDVRRNLRLMDESVVRARQTGAGLRGTLSIGFGGSIVYSLLPGLVKRFREAVPDVEIKYQAMAVLRQIEALRHKEIDLGILRLPVHDELLETRFVHREPLIVALPTDHLLLRNSGPVRLADLASSRFITYLPTRGFNYHADLHALCRIAGFEPAIAHEAATTEAVIGIVGCGEGVALVPASAERLRMRGVSFRSLETKEAPTRLTTVEFALAWSKNAVTSTTLEFVARAVLPF